MNPIALLSLDTSEAIVLDVAVDTVQQRIAISTLANDIVLLEPQSGAIEQLKQKLLEPLELDTRSPNRLEH